MQSITCALRKKTLKFNTHTQSRFYREFSLIVPQVDLSSALFKLLLSFGILCRIFNVDIFYVERFSGTTERDICYTNITANVN